MIALIRISSNLKIIADAVTPREALKVLKKIVDVRGHHFGPTRLQVTSTDCRKSIPSAIPPRLRPNKQFRPCPINEEDELQRTVDRSDRFPRQS
jgi:hypothetical protein